MSDTRILARALAAQEEGSKATLEGWVHRVREFGAVSFVVLRDRSGLVQLVLEGNVDISLESVVRAHGTVARNPKAPGGTELRVEELEVIARAAGDLPYPVNADPAKIGLDVILDRRPLSLRNPKIRAIFRVQATIIDAFGEYLRSQDFTEMKTSKLIAGGTEGGTGLFEVQYFDKKVYLAQSPQFYKQTMVASGLERVFEVAPAYRAEKHDTPRHLNEYVSMDLEMGFIESEHDLINLEKELLAHIFDRVARDNAEELALWEAAVPTREQVMASPTIAHDEAIEIARGELAASHGAGKGAAKGGAQGSTHIFEVTPEVERLICQWSAREHDSELVFLNAFPRKHRPFYTYPKDSVYTMSFDAIFRGLEITTGGRRINEYDMLLEGLPKFGLRAEDLEDYLAVFRWGCPPHGGFAIGCERLTQKILGLSNVKEASLFPRDRKRTSP